MDLNKKTINLERQFRRIIKYLHWRIDGLYIHCLPLNEYKSLTPERVEELYNVNFGN